MMDVATVDGTALASTDYTTVSQKIIFLPGQSRVIVTIPILDDTVPREPDEYFFFDVILNTNTIARSVVTIIDNDHDLIVEFSSSSYIGSESLKGVPVTLVITKGTIGDGEAITVNIVATSHSPISAEGYNIDFSATSVPITFTNRVTNVSSVVPVFQDKVIEDIETFDLSIEIPSIIKHRISTGRQRRALANIIDSTIIDCPANFKLIAMQKSNSDKVAREEVRSAIKNVLDIAENVTTDKEAFTKIAATINVENTTENFVQFQNAMNEISEASYEACYGSSSSLVLLEETQEMINKFKEAVLDSKSSEARQYFGRLLCLREKYHINNTLVVKRDDDIALLKKWFGELSLTNFTALFNFHELDITEIPALAFVVDDTGSMSDEIDAVKELLKAIIKAERHSPVFYILGTFNDPVVGEAKRYISNSLVELNELKSDVEAIVAHDGGDCPELGMEGILRALDLATNHSQVIVLTDAGCKDYDKKDEVVALATSLNTRVNFFFSRTGCKTEYEHYKYVQHNTGGVSVDTIESFHSLTLFITELDSEELSKTSSKRNVRSVVSSLSSSHKCQTFNISMFTTKFEVVVNQNSTNVRIYNPLGYSVKNQHISDNLSGYISKEQPRYGSWRICTVKETSEFTISKNDILDFSVDYYYQDRHYSAAIPVAGTTSVLSMFTTQLDNILVDGNLTLSFISEDKKFVGSTPLLYCSGYLLGRIVIPNVKFVYKLSGNDKFGNSFSYTKRSSVNVPKKPYFLQTISKNKTVNTGSKVDIYFSLRSTNAATSPLSFNITASTSPTELVLRYQATVTVDSNDTEIVGISVETRGTDMPGDYVVKVTASADDLILTRSQVITLVKPDDSSCRCLNGGTCRYLSRRGRTVVYCLCPTGYAGNNCQIISFKIFSDFSDFNKISRRTYKIWQHLVTRRLFSVIECHAAPSN